jgi:hypothetical protein
MDNDPREWVAVRTSGWWCEEPGLWDTPLRCVSLQPPATPSTVYAWDHRNRLIGVTEFDDEENTLSVVEHEYDLFNRWIRRSVDPDGPGGAPAVDTYFSCFEGQLTLQFDGTGNRARYSPRRVEKATSSGGGSRWMGRAGFGRVRSAPDYTEAFESTGALLRPRSRRYFSSESRRRVRHPPAPHQSM